ncbi:helix-turn-helix transcriptional regulator [Actinoallomurus bryophytorum]|uniref:Helix-turn-helix protein n=1 Tax=Actinoallomurus bryophytorum TaxID=1490222 RepID=A0A543CQ69_9ACTN|nr:helix-turn-helix transcriptional regulator [Actinoallomurus bryophytorum]TQL99242.1 helix-turn-helix protein [Actinoallomurus bryophytorum]
MSSEELAAFLRARRAALQPHEIGIGARPRRRTRGLRREDVAALAAMSADYYRRLEQARVAPPSPQILDAIARALRLTADECDYLYRVCDRRPPPRPAPSQDVAPALRQLVDGLGESPAMVVTALGETLVQNPAAIALLGDHSVHTGDARNSTYRWFTDPSSRSIHPPEEHEEEGRARIAELRARSVHLGDPRADRLIRTLLSQSAEFERLWQEQRTALCRSGTKTLVHPVIGTLDLQCQILENDGYGQLLVVFTAAPGSRAAGQLRELMAAHAGRAH